jgi:hypothetical protein
VTWRPQDRTSKPYTSPRRLAAPDGRRLLRDALGRASASSSALDGGDAVVIIRIERSGSGEDFMESYLGVLAKEIREELAEVRCPAHGRDPSIALSGSGPLQIEYRVDACCSDFRGTVRRRLRDID